MNYQACVVIYLLITILQIVKQSLTEKVDDNIPNEIGDSNDQPPEVEIDSGKLIGTFIKTASGRKVYAFLGIPYAAPPTNENRFMEPRPVIPWNHTRQATDINFNECIQINHYRKILDNYAIQGDEDCLYLNVYTPKLYTVNSSELLDVIFFIHGGAFMFANGKPYMPKYFLDKTDLVFVSINYRLGPLGFLTMEDEILPGNNGLKDQVYALRWVKENILKFGGDYRKVTIAGMSAGGASVHYHFLSHLSRNLFSKGISISGTATNSWALMENGRNKTMQLANSLNCSSSNTTQLIQCLSHIHGNKIMEKVKELFMPWMYSPFSPFGPTVEVPGNDKSFLTETPYEIIKKGAVKNAPWLLSVTADEGLYPAAEFINNDNLLKHLNNNWNTIAPHLLDFNYTIPFENHNFTSEKICHFYFANKTIDIQTRKKLVNLLSDRLFLKDIGKAIKLQAESTNSENIYLYKFSFRGKQSLSDFLANSSEDFGVSHGDDLPYILGCYFTGIELRSGEKEIRDRMVNMWLTFLKTGKPNPSDSTTWYPISKSQEDNFIDYLDIKSHSDMKMVRENDFGNWKFWDALGL